VKKVLVTGAEGFCGRYLCEYLAAEGYQVTGTYHHTKASHVAYSQIQLDITNPRQVDRSFQKLKPHYVCHLAAQSNARLSWEKKNLTFSINILGTLNLAKAILRHAPQARFLYTSSVQVYGRTLRSGKPVDEKGVLWPENPYAVSKALSEFSCLELARHSGLDVVIIRANNLFGKGQTSDFVFGDWCRQIAEAEAGLRPPKVIVGNTRLRRDFLPVEDGIKAYALLLKKGKRGEIYNLSGGNRKPLSSYLRYLVSRSKISLRIVQDKSRFRADDPLSVSIHSTKLRKLGWRLSHTMEHHLNEVLNEWRRAVQS
jgi:GDP-4-dehydro-6-deoxy-D-mannose reductase